MRGVVSPGPSVVTTDEPEGAHTTRGTIIGIDAWPAELPELS